MTPMKKSPEIAWLATKWGLPEPAFDPVEKWMDAELGGSTALLLDKPVSDWGQAAAPAGESSQAPLVVVSHKNQMFLQSRRLFETEQEIARRILALAREESALPGLDGQLKSIFPDASPGDKQVEATRTAIGRILTLVTGGPGTGKTFTLARILSVLANEDVPARGIRLAAPSGKAADRMKSAIAQSLEGLPESCRKNLDLLRRIAESSSTIHSLLGYRPDIGRCRFGRDNPLPCSALILDECSMIDVHLWRALLEALPAGARLILLGDPNQLTSVGQGNVFGELVRAAASPSSPLRRAHVHLTEARRFHDRPDILALAKALECSDADKAATLLENSRGREAANGLAWIENGDGQLPLDRFPQPILSALERVAAAETPRDALDALGQVCILTAQREYFVGARAMSQQIENALQLKNDTRNHPVIINQNDPETGLRNGTVGVIHSAQDGRRRAYFPSGDGSLKEFPHSKLPDHSPAWAITIHRSQGSEFDHVMVILPREESPMTTRELLYTAITRAKNNVYVAGDLASVKKAAVTSSNRTTLLAAALG